MVLVSQKLFLCINKLPDKKEVEVMTRQGYIQVSIPESLIEEVDEVVKIKKKGFSSRAEFVKASIRALLERVK